MFCPIGERARTTKNAGERKNGAEGGTKFYYNYLISRGFSSDYFPMYPSVYAAF